MSPLYSPGELVTQTEVLDDSRPTVMLALMIFRDDGLVYLTSQDKMDSTFIKGESMERIGEWRSMTDWYPVSDGLERVMSDWSWVKKARALLARQEPTEAPVYDPQHEPGFELARMQGPKDKPEPARQCDEEHVNVSAQHYGRTHDCIRPEGHLEKDGLSCRCRCNFAWGEGAADAPLWPNARVEPALKVAYSGLLCRSVRTNFGNACRAGQPHHCERVVSHRAAGTLCTCECGATWTPDAVRV